jgi:hypothetical protein
VGAAGEAFLLSAVALPASLMSSHPEQVTRILRSFDAENARVALSALKRGGIGVDFWVMFGFYRHRRLTQKGVVLDLLNEEIRHVGARDEPVCPVARIAIGPRIGKELPPTIALGDGGKGSGARYRRALF